MSQSDPLCIHSVTMHMRLSALLVSLDTDMITITNLA